MDANVVPLRPANAPAPVVTGGLVQAIPLAVTEAEDAARRAAEQPPEQAQVVTGLAGYVKTCFSHARDAKRMDVEKRLVDSLRAKRREYDPQKLAAIRQEGGAEVYAGLTASKCRAASAWLRDVLLATGSERPWAISPTPIPELPAEVGDEIAARGAALIQQALAAGAVLDQATLKKSMKTMADQARADMMDEARRRTELMAQKMEDQLVEGQFLEAVDAFIDDLVTFPAAVIKGPIVRRKKVLSWGPDNQPVTESKLVLEWERVSPFDIYPSPQATTVDNGYLLQKHQLTRKALTELKGVEGYSSPAIDAVLTEYGRGGLRSWWDDESVQADAEGRSLTTSASNPEGLIDALEFWGSVQGQWLVDWGMDKKEVPDLTAEHDVQVWLIGTHVIKAVLNGDPLCRKPYYKASYETIPGNWWGSSVPELVKDPQDVVNAALRALVNNVGISSGPQVMIKSDRLAAGHPITALKPWQIWQMTSDPLGSTAAPIDFFQPSLNAVDLIGVAEKFSELADEYSGIPRYMTGENAAGGAGRTASGLSMLISNAGKSIKQVVSNVDIGVMKPLLERQYYYNMRYSDDPELKGDVQIVARGATVLVAKEAAQVRRAEFLASTNNPVDLQITGLEGRAAVLRESAKGLELQVDKIVPPPEVVKMKAQMALVAQQQAAAASQEPASGGPSPSGQSLADGQPVVDNFSPPSQ